MQLRFQKKKKKKMGKKCERSRDSHLHVGLMEAVEAEVGKAHVAEQPQVADGAPVVLQHPQRPVKVGQGLLPAAACCNGMRRHH